MHPLLISAPRTGSRGEILTSSRSQDPYATLQALKGGKKPMWDLYCSRCLKHGISWRTGAGYQWSGSSIPASLGHPGRHVSTSPGYTSPCPTPAKGRIPAQSWGHCVTPHCPGRCSGLGEDAECWEELGGWYCPPWIKLLMRNPSL